MPLSLRDGESEMLAAVVANLPDDLPKLVYADWLDDRGDDRAGFLRAFVRAAGSMTRADFPPADGSPGEWVELIGYHLLERAAAAGLPEFKEPLLRLARPALRMEKTATEDAGIPVGANRVGSLPVGASKIGGLPDLPPGFAWPTGADCRATYNDSTAGVKRLAGFLAQINLTDTAGTRAGRDLPDAGLLSFFGFQDLQNDNPDKVGVMSIWFPDAAGLVRTQPPKTLTAGNEQMPAERLGFAETLDLPLSPSSPWAGDISPDPGRVEEFCDAFENLRGLNFENILGYAPGTSGGDPTPSKDSRHLIVLQNAGECTLHIQIPRAALAARDFGAITLNWVVFD